MSQGLFTAATDSLFEHLLVLAWLHPGGMRGGVTAGGFFFPVWQIVGDKQTSTVRSTCQRHTAKIENIHTRLQLAWKPQPENSL